MTNSLASTNFLYTINNIAADVYLTGKTNIGAAVDFVSAQAPQVAQEFIAWHMIDNAVSLAMKVLSVLLILGIGAYISRTMTKSNDRAVREFAIGVKFVGLLALIICGTPLACESSKNIKEILKAKYSPRIVLIEKAADLVNDKKR